MKKMKTPPKLTKEEIEKIENWLWLDHWHFETLFLKNCTEISSFIILWSTDRKHEPEYARVYGLQAVYTNSGKRCIANIFIRYSYRVYRVHDICQAAEIVQLLKKETTYDQYLNRVHEEKNMIKQKTKTKIKRLGVVAREKVA